MGRRKLIFYSTAGPDQDGAAWAPFKLAGKAVNAGLEAEIVLAGPGTGLMRADARERVEGRVKEALDTALAAKVPIYLSPG